MALGFYDYGNEPGSESALNKADGGLKDMFYPEWCRNLSPDSIWQQMADRRYELSWYHEPIVANAAYTPPEITVDPIPIGSYAKHPQLEGVYQFLCDGTVYQSSILDTIVDKGSGMYLHYPISLI
jgi:hypothetical protein